MADLPLSYLFFEILKSVIHQLSITYTGGFFFPKGASVYFPHIRNKSPQKKNTLESPSKAKDMCTDTVEEPTVVRDNYCTAGEIFQTFFQSTQSVYVDIIGRARQATTHCLLLSMP